MDSFDEQSDLSGRIIRTVAKICMVISEIISWPIARRALNVRVGEKVIKQFIKSIPTHAIFK